MAAGATSAGNGGCADTPRSSSRGHPFQPVGVTTLPATKTAVRIGAAEEVGGCGHGRRRPVISLIPFSGPAPAATAASPH